MKNRKRIWVVLLLIPLFLLTGCEEEKEKEATAPEIDPKAQAEAELLNELGIEADAILKKASEEELPTVLPIPPSLPATDADLGISQ